MDFVKLKETIDSYISVLYPGTTIEMEVDYPEESYSSLLPDGSMLVKGDLSYKFGYKLTKLQPFSLDDIILVSSMIEEMNKIEQYKIGDKDYLRVLQFNAMNKVICKSLSVKSYDVILGIIDAMSMYSERTYEGQNISFGFLISENEISDRHDQNLHFRKFLASPFSSLLSNGRNSFIVLDQDGYILKYLQLDNIGLSLGLAPYDYSGVLQICNLNYIAITLHEKGEILIYKDNELKYTKKGGIWNSFSHREIIKRIHHKSQNDNLLFAKSIYLSSLDVSFTTHGGIICYLNQNEVDRALEHIDVYDIVNEKYYERKKQLEYQKVTSIEKINELNEKYLNSYQNLIKSNKMIKASNVNRIINNRKFFALDRKLREELIEIDGATIVDYDGTVIAVGAIIKIEAGSSGGGRLAATKTLANYGVAINISSDGSVVGYAQHEDGKYRPIFSFSNYISN